MDWLDYHHLPYFGTVAKENSVSKAAASLHVAQPTVSAQLRALERRINHPAVNLIADQAKRRLFA